jgi:hypothetical protein
MRDKKEKEEKMNDNKIEILEIYKTYVETADRISDRRVQANNLFITLNLALGGYFLNKVFGDPTSQIHLIFLSSLSIVLNGVWFLLIKNFKEMNSVKFKIINEIEDKYFILKPFKKEWEELKKRRYKPFTKLELGIPLVFIIFYIVSFVILFCRIIINL